MEREDVLERTVAFVCRNFIVDRGDFALDQSLIDQGIIDSFGLVELSGFMQSEYRHGHLRKRHESRQFWVHLQNG